MYKKLLLIALLAIGLLSFGGTAQAQIGGDPGGSTFEESIQSAMITQQYNGGYVVGSCIDEMPPGFDNAQFFIAVSDAALDDAWLAFEIASAYAAADGKQLVPTSFQRTKAHVHRDVDGFLLFDIEYTITYDIIDANIHGPFVPPEHLPSVKTERFQED